MNGNVQSHDKEESKLNSALNANSGAHTLAHGRIELLNILVCQHLPKNKLCLKTVL